MQTQPKESLKAKYDYACYIRDIAARKVTEIKQLAPVEDYELQRHVAVAALAEAQAEVDNIISQAMKEKG